MKVPEGATVTDPEAFAKARALASEWINNAHKAVNGAFPGVNWAADSPETQKAQEQLEWYIWAHFFSGTATISDVRDAWRNYYRLHLPGQITLEEEGLR